MSWIQRSQHNRWQKSRSGICLQYLQLMHSLNGDVICCGPRTRRLGCLQVFAWRPISNRNIFRHDIRIALWRHCEEAACGCNAARSYFEEEKIASMTASTVETAKTRMGVYGFNRRFQSPKLTISTAGKENRVDLHTVRFLLMSPRNQKSAYSLLKARCGV